MTQDNYWIDQRYEDTSFAVEQEKQRVFGSCGGKCGEAPCIAWNKENDRKKDHRERREDV